MPSQKRWVRPAGFMVLVALAVWANRSLDLSWAGVVESTRAIVEPLGA